MKCANQIAADVAFSIDEVDAALAHPDMVRALASAPVLYGFDNRTNDAPLYRIIFADKTIDIGQKCLAGQVCTPIPPGVEPMRTLLNALGTQQRAVGECIRQVGRVSAARRASRAPRAQALIESAAMKRMMHDRLSKSKFRRVRATCCTIVALMLPCATGCESDDENPAQDPEDCSSGEDGGSSGARKKLSCPVAIIGGGAGGLHTAYRLGDELGKDVCLFEKEARLGGRIYDVSRDGKDDSPRIGVGARRIMETQEVVFALADELGIEYAPPTEYDDLFVARGVTGFSSDELNTQAYPALPDDADYETTLYEKLLTLDDIDKYSDFQAYARATVGAEGFEFLHDVSRFRADFQAPLDARGYMDYFVEEWDTCCTYNYPKGGMSEFIRLMASKSEKAGVRIYTSDAVASIERAKAGFKLLTKEHEVSVEKLVIAVDAGAFKWIRGDLAADIQAQQEFQQLVGVKAVSVTQWWPRAWWEGAIADHDVKRARTTQSCLNVMEIPSDPYGGPQNVTRTVYTDDARCVALWEEYITQGNSKAIEAEIARDLAQLFPGVDIPKPDKTFGHVWENAWYWLKAGSPFTNLDIAKWAVEPLKGEPVSLVGESYNPQRSGWSDAAYKSSIATLNARFDKELDGDARTPKARDQKRTLKKHGRNAIGH